MDTILAREREQILKSDQNRDLGHIIALGD